MIYRKVAKSYINNFVVSCKVDSDAVLRFLTLIKLKTFAFAIKTFDYQFPIPNKIISLHPNYIIIIK
ncbi:hypothetical protein AXA65_11260 [Chryseobacterium sp. FP211-J200]|nr:hypothetical protein AXA65_11260 [Chryseobacterium sp. FP211-J200]